MQTPEATPAVPPPEPAPFASCRYCGGDVGRTEQVAVFSSGKVAHVQCYDRNWLACELADRVGAS